MVELNNPIFAFCSLFPQINDGEGTVLEMESLCCITRAHRRGRSNKPKYAHTSLSFSQHHTESTLFFTVKKMY